MSWKCHNAKICVKTAYICVLARECESAFVVSVSVLWCSGRTMQTVECLVTWRLDSTAVLAAFRAGDPVRLENWGSQWHSRHTHNAKKDTPFKGSQHAKLASIISVVLALAFSTHQTSGIDSSVCTLLDSRSFLPCCLFLVRPHIVLSAVLGSLHLRFCELKAAYLIWQRSYTIRLFQVKTEHSY